MIVSYGELLQIDAVVVGMLTIGILGYLLNEVFLALERRLFPWRRTAKI
jgi:NitT/TauT family transport system permease protein